MKRTLRRIDNALAWTPRDFIYMETDSHYHKYDYPHVEGGLFYTTTEEGYYYSDTVFTKFGEWYLSLPTGFIVFLVFIEILAWLMYLIPKVLWVFLKCFLPTKWFLSSFEQDRRKVEIFKGKIKDKQFFNRRQK